MTTIRTTLEEVALPILHAAGLTIEDLRSGQPSAKIREAYQEISSQSVLMDDSMLVKYLNIPTRRIKNLRQQTYANR